mmetsp:Transcript_22571/g.29300  ORF Transcript_22571/g.29300 Transcript_22571/m.29300 type:complete len:385 (+) Transcript_22571:2-1156(+)
MPSDMVFQPQKLYDILDDSEGGIAEFILPAFYAGHLSHVWWLRSPWCDQFTDGYHEFMIGKKHQTKEGTRDGTELETSKPGVLQVSCLSAYYLDDEVYASEEELDLADAKVVRLFVSTLVEQNSCQGENESSLNKDNVEEFHPSLEDPWVLDICFDYFSTLNPFFKELMELVGMDAARMVQKVFSLPKYQKQKINESVQQVVLGHSQIFKSCIKILLDPKLSEEYFAFAKEPKNDEIHNVQTFEGGQPFVTFDNLFDQMAQLYPSDVGEHLIAEFLGFTETLSLEQREKIHKLGFCLSLPMHTASEEDVCEMVNQLGTFLKGLPKPKMVFLARSVYDGFTPKEIAPVIEQQLLNMLKSTYGDIALFFEEEDSSDDDDSCGKTVK